jgi:hypothetical protein
MESFLIYVCVLDYLFLFDGAFEHGQLSVHTVSGHKRTIDLHSFTPQKAYFPHHTRIFAGESNRYGSTPSGFATLHPMRNERVYGVLINMHHMHSTPATAGGSDDRTLIHKNDILLSLDKLYRVDQREHALYKRELIDVYQVVLDEAGIEVEGKAVKCFVYIKISNKYLVPPNAKYLQNMRELLQGIGHITGEEDPSSISIRHLNKHGDIVTVTQ